MSLKKIATKVVVTLYPKASIYEAAKLMREQHVGDVVVVSEENHKKVPIGILTDRDIVMSIVAFGVDPKLVSVGDVMAPSLILAKTTDSFFYVLNLMKQHGIKRLPLIGENGTLEGIITFEDLVSILATELSDVAKITEHQKEYEIERRRKIA